MDPKPTNWDGPSPLPGPPVWDGQRWRSPDGAWIWDGNRWNSVPKNIRTLPLVLGIVLCALAPVVWFGLFFALILIDLSRQDYSGDALNRVMGSGAFAVAAAMIVGGVGLIIIGARGRSP